MNAHKNDLSLQPTPALLARRRRLAARLPDVEGVLVGSLTEQTRRCGRPGCRCAQGEPHGPYAYFTPKPAGRGRARYVPAGLVAAVRARLARGEQVATVVAEISAINAELLARRELR
jgi:Family of unknown function (DUF6788)